MLKVDLRYLIYFARVVKKVRVDLEKLLNKTKHKKVDKIDPWSRWRERKKKFCFKAIFLLSLFTSTATTMKTHFLFA